MDASNLATLFTPNVLHNFAEETAAATSGVTFASSNTEKLEYVAVMKTLVKFFRIFILLRLSVIVNNFVCLCLFSLVASFVCVPQ